MFNPEKQVLENILAKEEPLSSSEEAVYNWYIENPKWRAKRKGKKDLTDMEQFNKEGVYSSDEVKKDKISIIKLREKKIKDKTERGELFEFIVSEYGESGEWFGDMYATKAAEYDDWKNHTDLVLEGQLKNGEKVCLSVDCWAGENLNRLRGKIGKIADEIKSGQLAKLKYFYSEATNRYIGKARMPGIVLAVSSNGLKDMCDSFVKITKNAEGAHQEFADLYLPLFFLMQAKAQLEKQKEILAIAQTSRKYQSSPETEKALNSALEKITDVLEEKKSSLGPEKTQRAEREFEEGGYSSLMAPREISS